MKNSVQKSILIVAMMTCSSIAIAQPMKLYCQGRYASGELLQLVITLDLQKQIIITNNSSTPIRIDEFNIIWRSQANGVEFESALNRWTGELNATMIESINVTPNFLSGLCQKIENRKF